MIPVRRLVAATAFTAFTAAVLTGCSVSIGTKSVAKNDVANEISTKLEEQYGRKPEKVECPANLEAKVGATLDCTLSDQGVSYNTHVTVTSVEGDDTKFDIKVADTPK